MNNLKEIVQPLLKWYQNNKRILPWRVEKDAYKIWISEIMLQQTRIEAVKAYYKRFMEELPTIQDLANIEEEKLLKLWEGLGYYNRARNLKKAAQIIVNEYNGQMPTTYQELIKLPGIGEYTAGAIASIAYHEKVTAVDGNVLRVISRVIGNRKNILEKEAKEEITNLLQKVMPNEAGDFNEGLMELGEVICLPNQEPLCLHCPLKEQCYAYLNNVTTELPVREKLLKRKIEEKTILILITENAEVALLKRPDKGLLAGMYEFPNVNQFLKEKEVKELLKNWNLQLNDIVDLGTKKHIFTHITWNMIGYQVKVEKKNDSFLWVSEKELQKDYAIPTAFYNYYNR